jgi:hypothetical protein
VTLDELKLAMLFSPPVGSTRDGQMVFSYEAIAKAAERLGFVPVSKRQAFAMLRSVGFTDTKSDGERRIAVHHRTFATLMVPTIKEAIVELEDMK